MRDVIWTLTLLMACQNTPEEVPEVVEPVVPEVQEEPEEPVADARGLAMSGRHADAVADAAADAALVAQEQQLLDGDTPWQQLVAALQQGDVAKARSIRDAATSPDQDAFTAMLVLSGERMDGDGPLTRLANRTRGEDVQPAAEAVGGWMAAVVRGEIARNQTDMALAEQEFAKAAQLEPIWGNLWRAQAAVGQPDAAAALGWAKQAAEAAIEAAHGEAFGLACDVIVALSVPSRSLGEALTTIQALHASVIETHGELGTGISGQAVARAALRAGKPAEAQSAAMMAYTALKGADTASEAAWLAGWTAYQVGDVAGLNSVVSDDAEQPLLALLVDLDQGIPPTAVDPTAMASLPDADQAMLGWEVAMRTMDTNGAWMNAAMAAADRLNAQDLQVLTRLGAEQKARVLQNGTAASWRQSLSALFGDALPVTLRDELSARAVLDQGRATTSFSLLTDWARLTGATATTEGESIRAPGVSQWVEAQTVLLEGELESAAATFNAALAQIPAHHVGRLAMGTAIDGSQGLPLASALNAVPKDGEDASLGVALSIFEMSHRVASYTDDALLGRDPTVGMDSEQRKALLAAVAQARHDVLMFHLGGEFPLQSLTAVTAAEQAVEWESFQRGMPTEGPALSSLREGMTGTCVLSYATIDGAVHGLALSPATGHIAELGSADVIQPLLDGYRASLEQAVEAVRFSDAATGDTLRIRMLEPFADVLTGFGRFQVVAAAPLQVVSPATYPEQASGLRYLADIRTVAQAPSFQMLALPVREIERFDPDFLGLGEEQELQTIEIVQVEESFSSAADEADGDGEEPDGTEDVQDERSAALDGSAEPSDDDGEEPSDEEPEPVVETRTVPGSEIPGDLARASRHFSPDFRQQYVGAEATESAYKDNAGKARYLYFADLAASADGGFVLADGALSLSEIRATPLAAEVIFINSPADAAQHNHRVRAFLEAGAQSVIIAHWGMPEAAINQTVDGFYQALNREREPAFALGEARLQLLKEKRVMNSDFLDNPALWGTLMFHGAL